MTSLLRKPTVRMKSICDQPDGLAEYVNGIYFYVDPEPHFDRVVANIRLFLTTRSMLFRRLLAAALAVN